MEGGKVMKIRVLFVIILCLILFSLLYIIYGESKLDDTLVLSTYTILYDNETDECVDTPEVIYKDGKYKYYLSCASSYDTYLLWDDGTKELIKNALDNNKVDIKSLENHGLKIIKNGK